eukprot:scaffold142_cov315-Prasinococcus_capsulatus_cf.AAC.6
MEGAAAAAAAAAAAGGEACGSGGGEARGRMASPCARRFGLGNGAPLAAGRGERERARWPRAKRTLSWGAAPSSSVRVASRGVTQTPPSTSGVRRRHRAAAGMPLAGFRDISVPLTRTPSHAWLVPGALGDTRLGPGTALEPAARCATAQQPAHACCLPVAATSPPGGVPLAETAACDFGGGRPGPLTSAIATVAMRTAMLAPQRHSVPGSKRIYANNGALRQSTDRTPLRIRRARPVGARAQTVAAGPLTEQQLVEYVAGGCKPKEKWRIGTEHEKFGFYKADKKRVAYEDIRAILIDIQERFEWDPIMEGDNIIGLKKNGQSVTLEPGGQLELSGAPLSTINETCAEVNSHLYQVQTTAEGLGIGFLGRHATRGEGPKRPGSGILSC